MTGSNINLNRTPVNVRKNKKKMYPTHDDRNNRSHAREVVVNTCQDEDGIGSEALYTANAPLDHLNHSIQVTNKNMETVRISPTHIRT